MFFFMELVGPVGYNKLPTFLRTAPTAASDASADTINLGKTEFSITITTVVIPTKVTTFLPQFMQWNCNFSVIFNKASIV